MTLVDAKHVEQHLSEEKPDGDVNETISQVAFADRLLLNKVRPRHRDCAALAPLAASL